MFEKLHLISHISYAAYRTEQFKGWRSIPDSNFAGLLRGTS